MSEHLHPNNLNTLLYILLNHIINCINMALDHYRGYNIHLIQLCITAKYVPQWSVVHGQWFWLVFSLTGADCVVQGRRFHSSVDGVVQRGDNSAQE